MVKLIALGDNCIDLYRNTGEAFPGGNAVNVAVHAANAGAQAEYLGALGTDCMAAVLLRALAENGVRYAACPILSGRTTKACCYQVVSGERTFLEVLTGESWAGPINLTAKELAHLAQADVIVSSCNAKIPQFIAAVAALPPVFAFDFGEKEKYRSPDYYDQVCRNGMDLAMFSCAPMDQEAFRAFCAPLHKRGVRHVLATLGCAGQLLSNGETVIRHQPSSLVTRDTMGAGDTFLAVLATSLAEAGWRRGMRLSEAVLLKALERASRAAAENCLRQGGIGVRVQMTMEEIRRWECSLNGHGKVSSG